MISIIARIPIKNEKTEEAIAAVKEFMASISKEEEGTLLYSLSLDPKNPNTFVFIERYRDKEAFDSHSKSSHLKIFFAKGKEFFAGRPEVIIMDEILSAK